MVAFYPDRELSMEVSRALVQGGCSLLEVQFPFSDPTADGMFIQKACDTAIRSGFTPEKGFSLVSDIRRMTDIPVFIMGYANTVVTYGVRKFLNRAHSSGAVGLIVPDLPPGYDEGLYAAAEQSDLAAVPIICPTARSERLERIFSMSPRYLYAVLRKGITGEYTHIGESNIRFLRKAASNGAKVLAGFGISTKEQVDALSLYVYAAVVGTAFVREIMQSDAANLRDAVYRKMRSLL